MDKWQTGILMGWRCCWNVTLARRPASEADEEIGGVGDACILKDAVEGVHDGPTSSTTVKRGCICNVC